MIQKLNAEYNGVEYKFEIHRDVNGNIHGVYIWDNIPEHLIYDEDDQYIVFECIEDIKDNEKLDKLIQSKKPGDRFTYIQKEDEGWGFEMNYDVLEVVENENP